MVTGEPQEYLSVVCWGTLFQVVAEVPDRTSATVAGRFLEAWTRYFGPPEQLIVDQGVEFLGAPFKAMRDRNATRMPEARHKGMKNVPEGVNA